MGRKRKRKTGREPASFLFCPSHKPLHTVVIHIFSWGKCALPTRPRASMRLASLSCASSLEESERYPRALTDSVLIKKNLNFFLNCASFYLSGACTDKNVYCSYWAKQGECTKNPLYMLHQCPISCNVCFGGVGKSYYCCL